MRPIRSCGPAGRVVHTALAMGSWFLLWVDSGPRTQGTAAALIAQVVARAQALPLFLTDGWKAYPAALLQVLGVVYRASTSWEGGPQAQTTARGPQKLILCAGREGPQQGGPCRGGEQTRGLRWPAPFWQAVAPPAAGRQSRPPLWNAGMAPCVGWSRPCGAARGVCPGATYATEGRSGSWSVSTTL